MLCKCYGLWAWKSLKVFLTIETTSRCFLFGLLILQEFLRLVVSFCTGSGALWTDTLGMALLLSPDPRAAMGMSSSLMTDCDCGTSLCTLRKASLVLLAGCLVNTAGGYADGQGLDSCPRYISRLGCGLKAKRLGCNPEHISCPSWCPYSCRWLGIACVSCIVASLLYILFLWVTLFGV